MKRGAGRAQLVSRCNFWHALGLLIALALAQQGNVRHELSHHAGGNAHDSGKRSVASEHCELCLSFAPVASGVSPAELASVPLARTPHEWKPVAAAHDGAFERLVRRNRGPPLDYLIG